MVKAAILLAVAAAVMGVLSFGGLVVGVALGILKVLFWVVTVIAAVLLVLGLTIYRTVTYSVSRLDLDAKRCSSPFSEHLGAGRLFQASCDLL